MELKFRPAVSKMSMLPCHIHVIGDDEREAAEELFPNFKPGGIRTGAFIIKFDHEKQSLTSPNGQVYPPHMLCEFEFLDEGAAGPTAEGEFEPARWWRVLDTEGKTYCETSSETEAREVLWEGFKLQRLYRKVVTYYDWRDQA